MADSVIQPSGAGSNEPAPGALVPLPGEGELTLQDLRFAYGEHQVLDGITASVSRGSILGVVGPSGCGKSTLLSIVAGLLRPDSGAVVNGLSSSRERHGVAMVFQRDTLLPWLTVADNVRLFTRFRRHGLTRTIPFVGRRPRASEIDARVDELLRLAGLTESRDRYPNQLSGGMRRRLAFLVAVAVGPDLLLLDEPFSSVDEPTRVGIHQDVYRITRLMGMTTILVTHDLAEAITLCDQILILTKTPAVIANTHTISFGGERQMLAIRETPEYLDYYGHLWHDLSEQIARKPRALA